MRWILAVSLITISSSLATADEEAFPYKAMIKTADAPVRSGPGKNFYPTDKLLEGANVEVYRHDPGGWCAIRPPDGSFCWVRARYLDIGADGTASVNTDEVVARVGSSLSNARDVIQVHLDKGEQLELVDGDDDEPGQWRKVAPPPGEFRWVAFDSIEKIEDQDIEPQDYVRVVYDGKPEPDQPDVFPTPASEPTPAEDKSLIQPTAALVAPKNSTPQPTIAPPVGEPTPAAPRDDIFDVPAEEVAEEPPVNTRARKLSRAALQREIVDLDLELSTRVAEETSTWDFDDLKARAEKAIEAAPTALDRAAVNHLVGKIDRFEQLRDGHLQTEIAQSKKPRSRLIDSPSAETQTLTVDTSRFDGMGRLAQVSSRQPGMPQYALVDGAGTVRYYINAAPGINLRPYMNKQIGVNGTRGQMAGQNRQMLNVQRITELPSTGTRR